MACSVTKHRHADLFTTQGPLEAPELNWLSTDADTKPTTAHVWWGKRVNTPLEQEGINPKLFPQSQRHGIVTDFSFTGTRGSGQAPEKHSPHRNSTIHVSAPGLPLLSNSEPFVVHELKCWPTSIYDIKCIFF